ncbi:MAG: hydrogenase assembly protein HypC [Chloroflexota bacterium]|nr:MAG: hydrogenase assembly protein HypC [Chloroflexota bacterium]
MCLGVPGKIIQIYETEGLKMGQVDFSGATREACLEYVPETKVGDYVLVHVGFAINVLSEEEAHETLSLLQEVIAFREKELADAEESKAA